MISFQETRMTFGVIISALAVITKKRRKSNKLIKVYKGKSITGAIPRLPSMDRIAANTQKSFTLTQGLLDPGRLPTFGS